MGNAHGLETLIAAAEELQTALAEHDVFTDREGAEKDGSQNSPPSADFRILNSSVAATGTDCRLRLGGRSLPGHAKKERTV